MPYRRRKYRSKVKKKPSRYRRKTYGKRYYKRRTVPKIPRVRNLRANTFPQKLLTTFTYNDTAFALSCTSGNSYQNYNLFRGNSAYDPDQTGVGIQPYYWDTLSEVYNRYMVYASKITIYLMTTTSAGTTADIKSMLFPSQTASKVSYDEPNDIRNLFKSKLLSWNKGRLDNGKLKFTQYCTSKQIIDSKNDHDMTSVMTSNPSLQWYWHFYLDTTMESSDAVIYCDVKIKYYVKLYERKNVDES